MIVPAASAQALPGIDALLVRLMQRVTLARRERTAPMQQGSGFTADSDRADVCRVLAGDLDAFAALVERHQGRIVSHLARLVGGEAEDLAQETFLRAYEALGRYDPAYPFRGWLLVIATRLAANHAAKRRERRFTAEIGERADAAADPSQIVAEADAAAALQRRVEDAVAALPLEARALYELRFRQQLPNDELARHFDISENALKVRLHRLRQALAARLGLALED